MQWRQNPWVKRGGLTLAIVLLFSGGYVWFWLRSPEHRVSQICGGMLPVHDTVDMISDEDDLKLEDRKLDRTSTELPELSRRCKANNIWVTIEPATGTDDTLGSSSPGKDHEYLPVPLGSGWTGFIKRSRGSDHGAVLLDCRNWGDDNGEGLFITVEDSDAGENAGLENRMDLARVLTGTARRAAEKTGCEAEFGSSVDDLPPVPPEDTRRISEATGTCKGMTSQSFARGTAAGRSPVEYCVLGHEVSSGPKKGLVLTAMYGPYAVPIPDFFKEPAAIRVDLMWASANCKGALGSARYWVRPQDERRVFTSEDEDTYVEPPTEAELADIARFAEESAARHGCEAPVLPQADDA